MTPAEQIVVADIDGVATRDNASRFGGIGPVGEAVWWGLRAAGIADRMLREAEPDTLAREWFRRLRELGHPVHLRTGRVQGKQEQITREWLARHCFEYDRLDCRPPGVSLVEFKLAGVRRSTGCWLYLEDNESLCRAAAKLGDDAPVVLQITDWRITSTVLAALTRQT